jgi:hypothetical protein
MNVVREIPKLRSRSREWESRRTHETAGAAIASPQRKKSTHYVASDGYRVVADGGVFVSSNAHANGEAPARFTWECEKPQNQELDASAVPTGTAPGNAVLDEIHRKPVRLDVH